MVTSNQNLISFHYIYGTTLLKKKNLLNYAEIDFGLTVSKFTSYFPKDEI